MIKRICSIVLLLVLCTWTMFGCQSQGEPEGEVTTLVGSEDTLTPAGGSIIADASSVAADVTLAPSTDSAEPHAGPYPITVTDLEGTQVTIEAADRIVSLAPSNTEILIAEGALERIVGVDEESRDQVEDASVVGDFNGPNVESIVALTPDVVFAGSSIQDDAVEQLRSLNIAVVCAEATTWDEVEESFRLVGDVINAPEEAYELCAQLSSTISDVEEAAPSTSMSVYYVLSYGEAGNWTSGAGSFINQMILYAGGSPITEGTQSAWLDYPIEDVIAADPDCIILSSEAGSYAELSEAPGYSDLRAVQQGMVFEVDSSIVTRPGPSLNAGLLAISGILQTAAEGPVPTSGLESSAAPE